MKEVYFEKLKEYCSKNGISLEKLNKQEKYLIEDSFIVAQPIKIPNCDGLRTDLATQPKPTLIYDIETGTISETEYTDFYLR